LALLVENDLQDFDGEKRLSYSLETSASDYAVIGATTTTSAIAANIFLNFFNIIFSSSFNKLALALL